MSDGDWFNYRPGVKVRRLGGEGGDGFYLVRMEPGALMPKDAHPQRETILVLEGDVAVGTWPAGDPGSRKFTDLFVSEHHGSGAGENPRRDAIDIWPSSAHELRAHPQRGALLLTVARPDFQAP